MWRLRWCFIFETQTFSFLGKFLVYIFAVYNFPSYPRCCSPNIFFRARHFKLQQVCCFDKLRKTDAFFQNIFLNSDTPFNSVEISNDNQGI